MKRGANIFTFIDVSIVHLANALGDVKAVLGDEPVSGISDQEVKKILWDHYFDVDETIGVIVGECCLHVLVDSR